MEETGPKEPARPTPMASTDSEVDTAAAPETRTSGYSAEASGPRVRATTEPPLHRDFPVQASPEGELDSVSARAVLPPLATLRPYIDEVARFLAHFNLQYLEQCLLVS